MSPAILPGATIGILGGGQLGRMLAQVGRRLGYGIQVLEPDPDCPTAAVADRHWQTPYDDLESVARFAEAVDVVTLEFESVPAASVAAAARFVPVRPGAHVLEVAQHRALEKSRLADAGLPVTPFLPVTSKTELPQALAQLGVPAVLKTATQGYDGKGQRLIEDVAEAADAWESLQTNDAIVERLIDFSSELSVVAARGLDGACVMYAPSTNDHQRHILDVSVAPALVDPRVAAAAQELARAVMESLDVVGVLCVEFFVTQDGDLLINELAPRPHNSGHLTIDACMASQFEQQLRAICGLPLGSVTQTRPAAMANLLGDLWQSGPPDWTAVLRDPRIHLHLYGKREPRPGRKMGHLTALAETPAEARDIVLAARASLGVGGRR